MNICLRTRGGLQYGWGHLVRTARLGHFMRARHPDWRIVIIAEGNVEVKPMALGWNGPWIQLPTKTTVKQEKAWLRKYRPDMVFVDMLKAPSQLLAILKEYTPILAAFNDLAYPYQEPDLIICPQLLNSYPAPRTGQRWLSGLDYFILPNQLMVNKKLRTKERIEKVLLVLGGALSAEVSKWLSKLLKQLQNQPYQTVVALGFAQAKDIARWQGVFNSKIIFETNPKALLARMVEADLAMAASGYVKMELAAAETPALLVSIVKHQDRLGAIFAEKTGAALYLGNINSVSSEKVIKSIAELNADQERRQTMAYAGRKSIDGQGAQRILDACQEYLRVN